MENVSDSFITTTSPAAQQQVSTPVRNQEDEEFKTPKQRVRGSRQTLDESLRTFIQVTKTNIAEYDQLTSGQKQVYAYYRLFQVKCNGATEEYLDTLNEVLYTNVTRLAQSVAAIVAVTPAPRPFTSGTFFMMVFSTVGSGISQCGIGPALLEVLKSLSASVDVFSVKSLSTSTSTHTFLRKDAYYRGFQSEFAQASGERIHRDLIEALRFGGTPQFLKLENHHEHWLRQVFYYLRTTCLLGLPPKMASPHGRTYQSPFEYNDTYASSIPIIKGVHSSVRMRTFTVHGVMLDMKIYEPSFTVNDYAIFASPFVFCSEMLSWYHNVDSRRSHSDIWRTFHHQYILIRNAVHGGVCRRLLTDILQQALETRKAMQSSTHALVAKLAHFNRDFLNDLGLDDDIVTSYLKRGQYTLTFDERIDLSFLQGIQSKFKKDITFRSTLLSGFVVQINLPALMAQSKTVQTETTQGRPQVLHGYDRYRQDTQQICYQTLADLRVNSLINVKGFLSGSSPSQKLLMNKISQTLVAKGLVRAIRNAAPCATLCTLSHDLYPYQLRPLLWLVPHLLSKYGYTGSVEDSRGSLIVVGEPGSGKSAILKVMKSLMDFQMIGGSSITENSFTADITNSEGGMGTDEFNLPQTIAQHPIALKEYLSVATDGFVVKAKYKNPGFIAPGMLMCLFGNQRISELRQYYDGRNRTGDFMRNALVPCMRKSILFETEYSISVPNSTSANRRIFNQLFEPIPIEQRIIGHSRQEIEEQEFKRTKLTFAADALILACLTASEYGETLARPQIDEVEGSLLGDQNARQSYQLIASRARSTPDNVMQACMASPQFAKAFKRLMLEASSSHSELLKDYEVISTMSAVQTRTALERYALSYRELDHIFRLPLLVHVLYQRYVETLQIKIGFRDRGNIPIELLKNEHQFSGDEPCCRVFLDDSSQTPDHSFLRNFVGQVPVLDGNLSARGVLEPFYPWLKQVNSMFYRDFDTFECQNSRRKCAEVFQRKMGSVRNKLGFAAMVIDKLSADELKQRSSGASRYNFETLVNLANDKLAGALFTKFTTAYACNNLRTNAEKYTEMLRRYRELYEHGIGIASRMTHGATPFVQTDAEHLTAADFYLMTEPIQKVFFNTIAQFITVEKCRMDQAIEIAEMLFKRLIVLLDQTAKGTSLADSNTNWYMDSHISNVCGQITTYLKDLLIHYDAEKPFARGQTNVRVCLLTYCFFAVKLMHRQAVLRHVYASKCSFIPDAFCEGYVRMHMLHRVAADQYMKAFSTDKLLDTFMHRQYFDMLWSKDDKHYLTFYPMETLAQQYGSECRNEDASDAAEEAYAAMQTNSQAACARQPAIGSDLQSMQLESEFNFEIPDSGMIPASDELLDETVNSIDTRRRYTAFDAYSMAQPTKRAKYNDMRETYDREEEMRRRQMGDEEEDNE